MYSDFAVHIDFYFGYRYQKLCMVEGHILAKSLNLIHIIY